MRAIILAPACSGKTTICRYLRKLTNLPILEMEDEFLRLHGKYPENQALRQQLIDQIFADVLSRSQVIFMCNTDFLSNQDILQAIGAGFTIAQLDIDLKTMLKRNKKRVAEEGYPDTSQWFAGMLEYQQKVRQANVVDYIIDARPSTEKVAKELLKVLNIETTLAS